MQASSTFRRSRPTLFIALTILVGALMLGGLAGYVLRGIGEPSAASVSTQAQVRQSTWSPGSALYGQGGRPAIVYSTPLTGSATGNVPPAVYEQGGRPPIVYSAQ